MPLVACILIPMSAVAAAYAAFPVVCLASALCGAGLNENECLFASFLSVVAAGVAFIVQHAAFRFFSRSSGKEK